MEANRKFSTADRRRTTAAGFSLIELLVVVSVILIIAAIAIPNFIKSKMRANESAAVQNIRNVTTANVIYSTTYGIGFSASLLNLSDSGGAAVSSTNAGLIDSVLAAGTKNGFTYSYAVVSSDPLGNVTGYSINADPISPGYTGSRHYYSDQTAVIRENDTASAGPSDNPL